MIQPVFLWTDILFYLLLLIAFIYMIWCIRYEHLRAPWRHVFHSRIGVISFMILMVYLSIGLLDSFHFRVTKPSEQGVRQTQVMTLLDVVAAPLAKHYEASYSSPFASHLYNRKTIYLPDGTVKRIYPKLQHVKEVRLASKAVSAIIEAVLICSFILLFIGFLKSRVKKQSFRVALPSLFKNKAHHFPWFTAVITGVFIVTLLAIAINLSLYFHVFGTDKIGQDVFYQAIKSIRTALIIGTLATLIMLPFAIIFGTMAGFFGGWIDDVIQYTYTTLSSIPAVLLIAAAVLALQIYMANHAYLFTSVIERADARLLALCVILGVTSWTTLCRLLRAETLKLREMEYVQAATALGASHTKILAKHIFPNMMHIVLITLVLDFSGLVLAEAVLSYVGVGVDPTTMSWGNMINAARLELAREPIVWWPLLAAFLLMFTLVLVANLFADVLRDAFDPRLRNV